MLNSVRLTLRIVAALVAVFILAILALIWRLSEQPIEATFLTPYIENAVNHYLPGTHTQIGHTLTSWDNIEYDITLHVDDLNISDSAHQIIATVPHMEIKLSGLGLLARRFVPLGLMIEHPQIKLVRDSAGTLRFGGLSTAATQSGQDTKNEDIKTTLAPVLDDLIHATRTHNLNITNVVLDMHDDKTQSDWSVHIPEITVERSLFGMKGQALLDITQKDQVSTLQIQYKYEVLKKLHHFETQFSSVTPSFFGGGHPGTLGLGPLAILDLPLTGNVSADLDNALNIKTVSADIHGDAGNLVYPDFWQQPCAVKSVDIKAAYDHDAPSKNLATILIDFGGPSLNLVARGGPSAVPEHDANFEIAVQIDNWPMDQFGQFWPKQVMTNPRDWITTNLTKGAFDHAEAAFKVALSWNEISNADITEASGKISASNARVNYLDGMPLAEGVNAAATFTMDQMTADISGGGIGALRLLPFSIVITDFQKDIQTIDIPLKFSGPITNVLKLIDVPRLGYAKAIGIKPDDVTGTATGQVELRFPLVMNLEMKDVDIKGQAQLADVVSSQLVKNVDITQGVLTLNLDKESVAVKGTANLNKAPSQITWKQLYSETPGQPLGQGNVTAVAGDEQWKQLNIDMFKGTHGPVNVTLAITQPTKDLTTIVSKLDLTGAEIHVDQLNWKKPSGVQALLTMTTDIADGKDTLLKSIDLSGPQATVQGMATLSPQGDELVSLNLTSLIAGRTNASVTYSQADDDDDDAVKTLRFEATGKSLDISGLKGGHDVAGTDPRSKEYHIHVDKLYTSDDGFIDNAQGYAVRDAQGWNEISLKGLADGDAPLSINLSGKDGKRYLDAACDNFGKALKGLGVTDTISDGKIQISGQSTVENPRIIDGTVRISAFTVKGLPALVVLLNATSPFGFQHLISGNTGFDWLKGKFHWQGDTVDFEDVHAPGPAVGLDVAGKVDMNAGTANLHGIVAPFSGINNMLGAIPLLGNVLTGNASGGGGGVLAVAYTITGDLNNPKVSVNPASLLTPGLLRNLFFGGSDDADEAAPARTAPKVGSEVPQNPATLTPSNVNKK